MAINYRKAVVDLASSLVGTATPATDETFISTYEKWVAKKNIKTNGTPMSAVFVTYVARMAGVPAAMVPNFVTSEELRTWAIDMKRYLKRDEISEAKPGDIVLFNDGSPDHVAIYIGPQGNKIEYIEGTLQGKTYSVQKRTRIAGSGMISGYFKPDYDWAESSGVINSTQLAAIVKPVRIQEFKDWLTETYGEELISKFVGRSKSEAFTKNWKRAAIAAWQTEMRMNPEAIDGMFDGFTLEEYANNKPVKLGSRGNRVMLLLGMLFVKGYDCKGWSTRFGVNGKVALEAFQKARAMPITGVADFTVWDALFNH